MRRNSGQYTQTPKELERIVFECTVPLVTSKLDATAPSTQSGSSFRTRPVHFSKLADQSSKQGIGYEERYGG